MSVPSRNVKKIVIYKGTVMISSSWVLMRVRELKAVGNSDFWRGHNKALSDVGMIIKKETHRVKWNARKAKANQIEQPK